MYKKINYIVYQEGGMINSPFQRNFVINYTCDKCGKVHDDKETNKETNNKEKNETPIFHNVAPRAFKLGEKPYGYTQFTNTGKLHNQGVWVIEIGNQYKIIEDNELVKILNRWEHAPSGTFKYDKYDIKFNEGRWHILTNYHNDIVKVEALPIFYVQLHHTPSLGDKDVHLTTVVEQSDHSASS